MKRRLNLDRYKAKEPVAVEPDDPEAALRIQYAKLVEEGYKIFKDSRVPKQYLMVDDTIRLAFGHSHTIHKLDLYFNPKPKDHRKDLTPIRRAGTGYDLEAPVTLTVPLPAFDPEILRAALIGREPPRTFGRARISLTVLHSEIRQLVVREDINRIGMTHRMQDNIVMQTRHGATVTLAIPPDCEVDRIFGIAHNTQAITIWERSDAPSRADIHYCREITITVELAGFSRMMIHDLELTPWNNRIPQFYAEVRA